MRIGGWGASSYQYAFEGTYHNSAYRPQRTVTRAVNTLINDFVAQDKPVGAVCHGVTVLAWARVDGASPLKERVVVGPAGGMPGFRASFSDYADGEMAMRWQVDANGALKFDNELVNWQLVEKLMSDKYSREVALGIHDDARMAADYELVREYIGIDKPFDVKTTYTNEFLDKSVKMTK